MPAAPLPVRDGLNPTRLRLPAEGPWPTVVAYLRDGFRGEITGLEHKLTTGELVDEGGAVIDESTPFAPLGSVYLYREPLPEKRVPFEIEILYDDRDLLVIDKPHFLATTPRGSFIVESATVRLRVHYDLPELSPAHRLDRVTAGVLVFTKRREIRGAYQTLFAKRRVTKTYEAIAPHDAALEFPLTVSSRIVKHRGTPRAEEEEGPVNAETVVELLGQRAGLGRYLLRPHTGKTHQLRLHMASLGIPIVGDSFYPHLLDTAIDDYSAPLQLLARSIAFADPITGEQRRFESARSLAAWPA
ncbi:MAG: tRNA pseudouridine32 synthase / rRNA pseudouridine746 synthase [Frankiaceae bacterium]|nr:tRNA pseudouridine32 synthase / rRNA pseudouridine746 synthase [Frankiaceae bacterium]